MCCGQFKPDQDRALDLGFVARRREAPRQIGVVLQLSQFRVHKGHAHFIDLGLVADVVALRVRISANAAVAVTLDEEQSGKPF